MKYLYGVTFIVLLAIVAYFLKWPPWLVFALSGLGIIPLAYLMGKATEELAERVNPYIGGLLSAALGNAAELIIGVFAIKEGLLDMVKASITGSILGNLLVIMGLSFLLGGLSHGVLRFDRVGAGMRASMLAIILIAVGIPSFFSYATKQSHSPPIDYLSYSVATIMVLLYILLGLFFLSAPKGHKPPPLKEQSSATGPIIMLASTVAGVAILSELLVKSTEPLIESLGITEFFLGIFIIPLVGNVAEHFGAVVVAWKGKSELSVTISLESSLQIALLIVPSFVFVSLGLGYHFTLVFTTLELISLGAAVLIASLISLDGEANWLEGVQLLAVYIILGLAFFFFPA
ncbi:MAG: calcium/proton exchanger [Anaerolineae bacterium]|nr:calcium/proton exchanger [Anaerolineae bacterium]MDW8103078.1 calcium/proton exchanger [Anaerolineae bacterium]